MIAKHIVGFWKLNSKWLSYSTFYSEVCIIKDISTCFFGCFAQKQGKNYFKFCSPVLKNKWPPMLDRDALVSSYFYFVYLSMYIGLYVFACLLSFLPNFTTPLWWTSRFTFFLLFVVFFRCHFFLFRFVSIFFYYVFIFVSHFQLSPSEYTFGFLYSLEYCFFNKYFLSGLKVFYVLLL